MLAVAKQRGKARKKKKGPGCPWHASHTFSPRNQLTRLLSLGIRTKEPDRTGLGWPLPSSPCAPTWNMGTWMVVGQWSWERALKPADRRCADVTVIHHGFHLPLGNPLQGHGNFSPWLQLHGSRSEPQRLNWKQGTTQNPMWIGIPNSGKNPFVKVVPRQKVVPPSSANIGIGMLHIPKNFWRLRTPALLCGGSRISFVDL